MTEPLAVRPLQWGVLPDLTGALPLDAGDMACLAELRAVLARHGRLDRFAVHLAHRHFELAPDEILIERADPAARTQHVGVGRKGDHPEAVPTTWLFDDGPELRLSDAAFCVCVNDPVAQAGCVKHGRSSSPSPFHQQEKAKEQERIQQEDSTARDRPVAGYDRERDRERER